MNKLVVTVRRKAGIRRSRDTVDVPQDSNNATPATNTGAKLNIKGRNKLRKMAVSATRVMYILLETFPTLTSFIVRHPQAH